MKALIRKVKQDERNELRIQMYISEIMAFSNVVLAKMQLN